MSVSPPAFFISYSSSICFTSARCRHPTSFCFLESLSHPRLYAQTCSSPILSAGLHASTSDSTHLTLPPLITFSFISWVLQRNMGVLNILRNPMAFQECRRGARTSPSFRQAFQLPETQVPPSLDEDPGGHNIGAELTKVY